MELVHRKQCWQQEQGPSSWGREVVKHFPLPLHPVEMYVSHAQSEGSILGKEACGVRLCFPNPKLIPRQTSPIRSCQCFFINQVCQTQRLEHSGSAYSKHRNINMKTTDPGTITGREIFIFYGRGGLRTLSAF